MTLNQAALPRGATIPGEGDECPDQHRVEQVHANTHCTHTCTPTVAQTSYMHVYTCMNTHEDIIECEVNPGRSMAEGSWTQRRPDSKPGTFVSPRWPSDLRLGTWLAQSGAQCQVLVGSAGVDKINVKFRVEISLAFWLRTWEPCDCKPVTSQQPTPATPA